MRSQQTELRLRNSDTAHLLVDGEIGRCGVKAAKAVNNRVSAKAGGKHVDRWRSCDWETA